MPGCQDDHRRNVQKKVARFQRPHLDGESAAEPENQRGKKGPEIEEDEIEFEGADETNAAVTLAERCGIGNRGEDDRDRTPRPEVDERAAPLRCSFSTCPLL